MQSLKSALINGRSIAATVVAFGILALCFAFSGTASAAPSSQPAQPPTILSGSIPITVSGSLAWDNGTISNTVSITMTGLADLDNGMLSLSGAAGDTGTITTTQTVTVTSVTGLSKGQVELGGNLEWTIKGIGTERGTLAMTGSIDTSNGDIHLKGTFNKKDVTISATFSVDPAFLAAQPQPAAAPITDTQTISQTEVWPGSAAGNERNIYVSIPGVKSDEVIPDRFEVEIDDAKVEIEYSSTVSETNGTLTIMYKAEDLPLAAGVHTLHTFEILGHPVPEISWEVSKEKALPPKARPNLPDTGTEDGWWSMYFTIARFSLGAAVILLGIGLIIGPRRARA